jgi:hypothetical protein
VARTYLVNVSRFGKRRAHIWDPTREDTLCQLKSGQIRSGDLFMLVSRPEAIEFVQRDAPLLEYRVKSASLAVCKNCLSLDGSIF